MQAFPSVSTLQLKTESALRVAKMNVGLIQNSMLRPLIQYALQCALTYRPETAKYGGCNYTQDRQPRFRKYILTDTRKT